MSYAYVLPLVASGKLVVKVRVSLVLPVISVEAIVVISAEPNVTSVEEQFAVISPESSDPECKENESYKLS